MTTHIKQTDEYQKSLAHALKQAEAAALTEGSVTAMISIRAAEAFVNDDEAQADAFVAKAMAAQLAGRNAANLVRMAPGLYAACVEMRDLVRKVLAGTQFDKNEVERYLVEIDALLASYQDGSTPAE